jgi:hypothetical protein
MKRKDYQKPSMQVVEVKPMGMLMTSDPSKNGEKRDNYDPTDDNPFAQP